MFRFERKDSEVRLFVNSGLGTSKPVYQFILDCGSQEEAELLERHMESEKRRFYKTIAKDFMFWLSSGEISAVKKELIDRWDGRNGCWK